MLLELAIGDAYGAGFEYAEDDFVNSSNHLEYVKHPRHSLKPGSYTDDTQMSIALAEFMLSREKWTKLGLAQYFLRAFNRDKRQGYAQGFYQFLCSTKNAREFIETIRPISDKSGAAMRAPVIGLYPELSEVKEKATFQAKLTHNTPTGINSAVASALMVHYFYYRLGAKKDLGHFLEEHVTGGWNRPWSGKVGPKGDMSVLAAITAIQESSSLKELLRRCIAFKGDVDTVAAIAMAAGSCCTEVRQDLPDHLYKGLEKGIYGSAYLGKLDQKLRQMFPNT